MKLDIEQTQPGEFEDADALAKKVAMGAQAALTKATGVEFLVKAMRQGGEIQCVDEVSQLWVDLYKDRVKSLTKDITALIAGHEDIEKAQLDLFGARMKPKKHSGGPYIGPRGGKWADPQHKIPWHLPGNSKSVGGKPGVVKVGGKKLHAEPTDTEDTFPPAIASFQERDGWLVYEGRNGSEGVVVGTRGEIEQWKKQVISILKRAPVESFVPWSKNHGGAQHLKIAREAANRVAVAFKMPVPEIEFLVSDKAGDAHGSYGASRLHVVNAHRGNRRTYAGVFEGIKTHAGAHIAAHEMAHGAFSKDPKAGKEAMVAVEKHTAKHGSVSLYHAMTNHHEGLMEAAALYTLNKVEMRKRAPRLAEAIRKWFESPLSNRKKPDGE